MKNWALLAATSGALLLATQAFGVDTATSNITLSGTVNKSCSLMAPSILGDGTPVSGVDADASIAFQNFVEVDGTHQSHTITLTYPGAMCNYSASMGLKSANGGLRPKVVAPAAFAGVVNYTAAATWGDATTTLNTSAAVLTGNNNALAIPPTAADLVVRIVTAPSGKPLIADGTPYSDILTVQLGQQL